MRFEYHGRKVRLRVHVHLLLQLKCMHRNEKEPNERLKAFIQGNGLSVESAESNCFGYSIA